MLFFAIETAAVQARPAYIRPHSSRRRVVQAREKFTLCDGCLQASTLVGGGLWKALGKWSPVGARASLGEGLFASYPANLICQAPASPFVRSSPMAKSFAVRDRARQISTATLQQSTLPGKLPTAISAIAANFPKTRGMTDWGNYEGECNIISFGERSPSRQLSLV